MRLLFLLLLTVTCSKNGYAQFTEIKRIELPDNYLIGDIQSIDVLGESFLITDMQEQVFLFEADTDKLIRLDPENCFPGFDLKPIHTFHLADSSIFLINTTLPGYRFEADGSCQGSVHEDFIQVIPYRLAIDENEKGYFYTLRSFPNQPLQLRKYHKSGRLIKEATLIKPPFPEFNYRFVGGGTAAQDGVLYYILPSGVELNRYDIERGVQLESIPFEPDYKPAIDEDISEDPFSPQMFKDLGEIMDDHYIVISMFKLSEKNLLLQTKFKAGENVKYGVHLFNRKSGQIEKKSYIFEQKFLFARGNRAYQVVDERMESDILLNPGIAVYEFTGN